MIILRNKENKIVGFKMPESECERLEETRKGLCICCGGVNSRVGANDHHFICTFCDKPSVFGMKALVGIGALYLTGADGFLK